MRTRVIAVLVPLLVLALGAVGTATAAPPDGRTADVIVVLDDGVDARDGAADVARDHGAEVSYIYEHALQGFAARVPEGRLNALSKDPRVASVEVDRVMSIQAQAVPTGIDRIFATGNSNLDIDATDDQRVDVDVAVIDTGIDFEHPDLNVKGGVDCTVSSGGGPPWARSYYCSDSEGTGGDDDHYHGTHVAGTIGAIDNGIGVVGVAPGARLWAVKVLDSSGSGYTSGIVAGIDWVVARGDIEVLNMSLGGSGSCSSAYQSAISNAVNNGVAVAVAAGNSGADAKNYSPASCEGSFAVSALADFDGLAGGLGSPTCRTDEDDTLADFSNFGSIIDIAAPGVCILSTYPIEQGSYGTISGTSMASPHAAGALALLASSSNPGNATDVSNLYSQVINSGNLNWTDESGDGSKEPLLDVSTFTATMTDGSGGDGGAGNTAPTASFSYSCTDLSCTFDGTGADADGDQLTYSWSFGDGNGSTAEDPAHDYASAGTYTVSFTVSDSTTSTTDTQSVTVTAPVEGGFHLTTSGYKDKGRNTVDLSWSGATSPNVDIYRNGSLLATTANDGAYTDATGERGGATYTFEVCEAGTSTCSNESTVVF